MNDYEQLNKEGMRYVKMQVFNKNEEEFASSQYLFFGREELNLEELHGHGYHVVGSIERQKKPLKFPMKKKMINYYKWHFKSNFTSKSVDYHQPTVEQLITCKVLYYKKQLRGIMRKVENDILCFKREYMGNNKFRYYLEVDEALQF